MTNKKLRDLYTKLLYIRRVEERISHEYQFHEIRCPTHLAVGQEAIAVGICDYLKTEDIVFSTHRSHAHYLAKGGDLPAFIAELYGKATGCAKGFGGSQHLLDQKVNFWGSTPIVASTIPVAVGAAYGVFRKKEKKVVVVFFGDAATEEGVFAESVNFAALHALPVIFVCENNRYSTNTPIRERQIDRFIFPVAQALGAKAFHSDGNDIAKVRTIAKKVVSNARSGKGPQFVEFETYRTLQHCGPKEDPPGYRSEGEKEQWKRRDPLLLAQKMMKQQGMKVTDEISTIEKDVQQLVDAAFIFAKESALSRVELTEELMYASRQ